MASRSWWSRAARGGCGRDPELLWFQARPGLKTWVEHSIVRLGEKITDPHDIQPLSVRRRTGQVIRGFVVLIDRRQLEWFQIPSDTIGPWCGKRSPSSPVCNSPAWRSVTSPARARGHRLRYVLAGTPSRPGREAWAMHRFGDWNDGGWGGMAKHAIADIDGDGRPEIVASEAEIPNSRLGVFSATPSVQSASGAVTRSRGGYTAPTVWSLRTWTGTAGRTSSSVK